MNEFDLKAKEWDQNSMHAERSAFIAKGITEHLPVMQHMRAMEYGAGTGILSFLLKDHFNEIVLIDSSPEMIKVTDEKISASGAANMKTLLFDLEKNDWNTEKFDVIYTQMTLHHIEDINIIFDRFYRLLKRGGYLAVADLCPEDGTFHDQSFKGHYGFDVAELAKILANHHFTEITHSICYTIKRATGNDIFHEYPVFLLNAELN